MSILNELDITDTSQMAAALKQGYETLSAHETVRFVKYVRFVLPADGFVFWIKADLLPITQKGVFQPTADANVIEVLGSFHYATVQVQKSDNTTGIQSLVFTTNTEIADFNSLQPSELYIGQFNDFRFSFSAHNNYYVQSGLWHYYGQAIYPYMESQIIDSLDGFSFKAPVVSNSLPIWMMMQDFAPLFPSYLVPENITPPYIVADIIPEKTTSLQPIPWVNSEGIWQLTHDTVRLIMYGMRNEAALNFVEYVKNQSLYPGLFGIQRIGFSVRDEKTIQSELNVIAEQKTIELDITYNQHAVSTASVQYIKKVLPMPVYINPP